MSIWYEDNFYLRRLPNIDGWFSDDGGGMPVGDFI